LQSVDIPRGDIVRITFIIALLASFFIVVSLAGDAPSAAADGGDVVEVTLITGDTVVVTATAEGRSSYLVRRTGQASITAFDSHTTRHGTYVAPVGHDTAKLDDELFNVDYLIAEGYHREDSLPVIVAAVDAGATRRVTTAIEAYGGTITRRFQAIPMLAAELPFANIGAVSRGLLQAEGTKKIWLDKRVRASLDDSVPLVGAPDVWAAGFRGEGIVIAVLDTGIDATHPDLDDLDDLAHTTDPKVLVAVDYTDDGTPSDLHGHGTHVAGIAAGTGSPPGGTRSGVAPGAYLWNLKVLNHEGVGSESSVIDGIERAALGIDGIPYTGDEADVINMSLGSSFPSSGNDPLSVAADLAVDGGLVVAVAAGNDGPADRTVGVPGVARKVITVGATNDSDEMAGFSSRGPTIDMRLKPDVVAPGVVIIAPGYGTSNYIPKSGTSMATPHVAGAAALVRQAWPGWDPLKVKSALMNTALALPSPSHLDQGAGRIRIDEAVATDLLAMAPSVSFGELFNGSHVTTTLGLLSLSDGSMTVDLTVSTVVDGTPTDIAGIEPSSLVIPAGGGDTITLRVNPDAQDIEGRYEGRVTATYPGGGLTVPFLFELKQSSEIEVTPATLDETTSPLEAVDRTVTIDNTGTGELAFNLRGMGAPLGGGSTERGQRPWGISTAWSNRPDGPRSQVVSDGYEGTLVAGPSGGDLKIIIFDPEGDSEGVPIVDVGRVDGASDGVSLTLQVFFSPDTDVSEAVGYIDLDVDQDPSTGLPISDIGSDFFLSLFLLPTSGMVQVFEADGDYITEVPGTYIGQSIKIQVPLTVLSDDGNLDVNMVLGNEDKPGDWAPDVGHGTVGDDPGLVTWLCFSPATGNVPPGGSQLIVVSMNCLGDLEPGVYTAEIVINSNDLDENPTLVTASLTVETPTAVPSLSTWALVATVLLIGGLLAARTRMSTPGHPASRP